MSLWDKLSRCPFRLRGFSPGVRGSLWDEGNEYFGIVQNLLWHVYGRGKKVGKGRVQGGLGRNKCGRLEGKGDKSHL